ncbi:FecR family protein [Flavobacterium sp.]
MSANEENYELAKWLAGEMSEKELISFQKTPEYETYSKIAAYSSQLQTPDFDADAIYRNTIKSSKPQVKVIPFYYSKWIKIAAIIVIFSSLAFLYTTSITSTEVAENGKKTNFSLPDNSQIVLNSGSEISYKKWKWENNRKLNLDGEAYFKVAHGKKFEVETKLGIVTVLGTQFNVKSRKDRFEVTCYQGKVRIQHKNQEVIITRGMSVTFENEYFDKHEIQVAKPEWTNNEIAFRKVNLQTITDELARQYDVEIVLNCKENTQRFSGILPSNNRKVALDIIISIFHLKISKFDSDKIILVDF